MSKQKEDFTKKQTIVSTYHKMLKQFGFDRFLQLSSGQSAAVHISLLLFKDFIFEYLIK